jgi:hypothetical protein
MTWTFTNNPSNSNRDLVRILIQDTNTSAQLLTDEYIDYTLSLKPSAYLAASLCAETLMNSTAAASAFLASNVVKKKVGDLELTYQSGGGGGGARSHYQQLAASLRRQAGYKVSPFAGGISQDDKNTQESDSDWDQPAFSRGMHDHYDTYVDSTR